MSNCRAFLLIMVLLALSSASLATSNVTCRQAHEQRDHASVIVAAGFRDHLGETLQDSAEPLSRHKASYLKFDPQAQDQQNLVSIVIPAREAHLPLKFEKINHKDQSFYLYDVGDSHLLPLNAVYEKAISRHPQFRKSETLGFKVSAEPALQKQIAEIATLRTSALNAVLDQLDPKIKTEAETGRYQTYDFFRQHKWRMNHLLRQNGDNDVFVIFDRPMNAVEHQYSPEKISSQVLATIQVSFPTERQFPQDYIFPKRIGTSQLDELPTVRTWKRGIPEDSLKLLHEIAGDGDIAEIGRYLNRADVPLPAIAKMLLQAFAKIEARNVKTIFVFGTSRNINAFTRFYGFEKIENFSYSVEVPVTGLPPESGAGAFHHVGSPQYLKMKEKLQKLAS